MSDPLSTSAMLELSSLSGIPVDDAAMAARIAEGAAAAVEAVRSIAAAQGEVDLDKWLFEVEPAGYLALLEYLAEDGR